MRTHRAPCDTDAIRYHTSGQMLNCVLMYGTVMADVVVVPLLTSTP